MKTRTLVFLLLLCLGRIALAQAVASVTHLSGVLTATHADGSSKLLALRSEVLLGDTLMTERDTYARLKFADASEIVLRPGSRLKVEKFHYEPARPEADSLFVSLLKGGMRAVSGLVGKRSRDAVKYTTPTATIGIRGTHFGALFCHGDCADVPTADGAPPADGLYLDVASGAILLSNGAGNALVNSGEFGYVRDAATAPVVVPAPQGIQVTMPASISRNAAADTADTADAAGGTGGSSAAQCVVR